ncbi:MFS transporter [Lentzea sp. BCCO 10_0856]|uniref:MFS transporter n=1 Tax=Lentzea miocenica TaxID=3095431 RepID=A0ABU4ST16_9PSEU|nr:MFS transporter [Lentzea sp. BCCO 10_0856]MDX8029045.1 MFS transporter [Lentzea sp. BCCO 10_0856]
MLRSSRPAMAVLAALAVTIGALESIPFPALPLLQRELGLDPAQAALLSTTLIITSAITMPIVAKIADDRGGRRTLLVLTWCIVVGAVLSAFATTFPVILLGQFLQGLGGGILPVSFVVARELFTDSTPVAVGWLTGLFTVGTGLGVLASGPLADALSRQWMFLLPALIVSAVAMIAPFVLPGRTQVRTARLDWPGGVLLALTLTTLMLTLFLGALVLLAQTLALGTGWVLVERRAAHPMVDPRILRTRGVWTASITAGALGASYSATYFLVPQLLSTPRFGATATDISLYLFPTVLVAVVVGPVSGLLVRRAGARAVVLAGLALTALGTLFISVWHNEPWQIVVSMLVTLGLGVGAASTATYTSVIASVGEQDTGVAAATCGIARAVGAALGVQVAAALLTGTGAFEVGFLVAAVVVLLPLALLGGIPGRSDERKIRSGVAATQV